MENILEIKNITKQFPGVKALNDVSVNIKKNSVHCIVGENGAGKSTFIKVLTGAVKRDRGKLFLNGQEFEPKTIKHAMNSGMSVLFQELNVVDQLSVEQNLTLGMEETILGVIRPSSKVKEIYEILKLLDPEISLKDKVVDLSVAKKQVIEIAKAIAAKSSIIIMDEPTAALSEDEVKRLFKIIQELKHQDVTVLYISHRLEEIFEIGEYVTVFRDGEVMGTIPISTIQSKSELIRMMISKDIVQSYIPNMVNKNEKVFEVKNLNSEKLRNINFSLFKGEILGFYGLVGAGKTEIAKAIYGADKNAHGTILINNRETVIVSPKSALKNGIAMVPEERRTEGLFTKLNIRNNITIINMKKITTMGVTHLQKEKIIAKQFIKDLRIATDSEEKIVGFLSGGNQQKVVVSKCLNAESKILLLDEPTRGVDVGAKEEIHNLIRELCKEGVAIIVFSSELPELLNLCDRLVLLYEGEIKSIFINSSDIDTEEIMHIATGGIEN